MTPALRRYAAPAAALLLALTACTDTDEGRRSTAEPTTSSSPTRGASGSTSDTATPTPTPSQTSAQPSSPPAGGTAEKPAALSAETALLHWQQVPGPVSSTATRAGDWTLTVNKDRTRAELAGPGAGSGIATTPRQRISDTFLDGEYAVVVLQDPQETRPSEARVTDLGSGEQFTIDGSSDVPTVNGGTWALGQGHLLHATLSKGAYCVASVDLASRKSSLGWCAPERHGFNSARITPAGDSLLTFDDGRPACRSVVALSGTEVEPFPGVTKCKAWDGLLVDDGAVWSVVPQERRVEDARLSARVDDAWFDLGPGTSGTLAWCADAAYFVRDPQRDGDPARLMRWNADDGLQTVYESAGGQAFLTAPRCGGDTLTLTAFTESGDEQVSAHVR